MSHIHHFRTKTEPLLSPESPFMRKPSREMLKKLNFKKSKQISIHQNSQTPIQSHIGYIHPQRYQSSGSTVKLKTNTIELSSFKIMHQNMLLKNQIQELKKVNQQLMIQIERQRKNTIFDSKSAIMGCDLHKDQNKQRSSPILSFSSLNRKIKQTNRLRQKQNDVNQNNHCHSQKNLNNINGMKSFDQRASQRVTNQISYQKGRFRTFQSCRTLFDNDTTSIENSSQQSGSRVRQLNFSKLLSTQFDSHVQIQTTQNLDIKNFKQNIMNLQIQLQSSKQKVQLLQVQIQKQKTRSNKLQTQNEALYLHIQMNKRKLLEKQQKIKKYLNKEKRQKLFELSSQSDSFY